MSSRTNTTMYQICDSLLAWQVPYSVNERYLLTFQLLLSTVSLLAANFTRWMDRYLFCTCCPLCLPLPAFMLALANRKSIFRESDMWTCNYFQSFALRYFSTSIVRRLSVAGYICYVWEFKRRLSMAFSFNFHLAAIKLQHLVNNHRRNHAKRFNVYFQKRFFNILSTIFYL